MSRRTLSRTAKRLEPFLNNSRKAITGGGSNALTAHAGLDYIVAHDTSDPTVNRNGTYYSYNFGVIGGAGVDESNHILAMLNTIGETGGGRVVIRAADPADPIHIAKTVSIYYSNMQVVFAHGQVVTYEDKASLRIMGDYAQITRKIDGTAMKLNAASTVVSNETVLQLSATDTALMDAEATPALRIVRVGDKIVVRGQNDISGKAIEKDTTFVKSLAKVGSYWEITCTDELDYTFQATYPSSEWPPDLTTGTTIYIIDGSLITASTAINDTVVAVTDGTVFAVGDMVEVGDNRNEYAMNASAITGAGNPYKNPANLEQAQIIAISGNNITLDHALCRSASTTYYAFMALMVPVVNSTISGARISYTADGIRSANALQITYSMDCHIYNCYVDGIGGRKGHGLRISYSYKCTAYRNHIVGALYTGSGEGYGITIYYATLIMVDHNFISGCRHNILLQLATLAKVISNVSIDDRISGIDLHGVYSVRCSIQNNDVSRSSLNTGDSSKPGGIRIGNTSHTGGDHYNVIEGNTITGYSSTTADGIDIFAASTGNVIRNNTVIDCTVGLRFGLNSSQITPVQFIDNTIVEGNIFARCTSRCIEIIAQPTYDNATSNGKFSQITFINNISDGNDRHFEITGVVTTLGITDVIMVGNQVINPVNTTTTYYGISVKYTSGFVHIYDNNVSKAQRGIYLQGNGVCHIIGNKTANTVQTDPYTDGTGNTSVNYVDAMTGSGIAATIVDAKGDLIVGTAADTVARQPAGADGSLIVYDSVQTTGLNTITPSALGVLIYAGGVAAPSATIDGTIRVRQTGATRYRSDWGVAASVATINAYDDTALGYIPLNLDTLSLNVRPGGSTMLLVSASGVAASGVITAPGATIDGSIRVRQSGATRYRSDYIVGGATPTINAYDDTGSVYLPFNMDVLSFNVRPSGGSAMLTVSSAGVTVADAISAGADITSTANTPRVVLYESDQSSGNRRWHIQASSSVFQIRITDDPGTTAVTALALTRSANVITLASLTANSIELNGAVSMPSAVVDGSIRVRQSGSTRYRSDYSVGSATPTINAYDDTGAVYLPFNFDVLSLNVRPGGTPILTVSAAGAILDSQIRVRQAGNTRYRSDHQVAAALTTINSYDDTGAVYIPMNLDASVLTINASFNAWTALPYGSDWSDYGSSNSAGRYRKIGDIVYVEGIIKRTPGSSATTIGTLPASFRPTEEYLIGVDLLASGTYYQARIDINTSGVITLAVVTLSGSSVSLGTTTIGYLILNNISFSTI